MNEQTHHHTPSELKSILTELGSDDFSTRVHARQQIVSMGKDAIDYLAEYINHPKRLYRIEVVKALSEIKDPEAIPLLLEAFYDDDPDIRWIAAEGLIKLGKASLIPLLKIISKDAGNLYVRRAAYHVLHHLRLLFPYRDKLNQLLHYLNADNMEEAAADMAEELFELLKKS